jgi:hypothetical protein
MVAVVGNTEEGIINVDYKVIIEVLAEVYFKWSLEEVLRL